MNNSELCLHTGHPKWSKGPDTGKCLYTDDCGWQWHCRSLFNIQQPGMEINWVTQASAADIVKNGSIVCWTISKQAFPFSTTSLCEPLCLSRVDIHMSAKWQLGITPHSLESEHETQVVKVLGILEVEYRILKPVFTHKGQHAMWV